MSLDDMGLLCKNGSLFSICPLGPIISRPHHMFKKGSRHATPITPSPTMASPYFDAQQAFQALNDRIDQLEIHFECILDCIATHLACLANKVTDIQATMCYTHQ